MRNYIKVIDYKKHRSKFFRVINGILIEVSKDIIIDDYEKELERLKKINNVLFNNNSVLLEYLNDIGYDVDYNLFLDKVGE